MLKLKNESLWTERFEFAGNTNPLEFPSNLPFPQGFLPPFHPTAFRPLGRPFHEQSESSSVDQSLQTRVGILFREWEVTGEGGGSPRKWQRRTERRFHQRKTNPTNIWRPNLSIRRAEIPPRGRRLFRPEKNAFIWQGPLRQQNFVCSPPPPYCFPSFFCFLRKPTLKMMTDGTAQTFCAIETSGNDSASTLAISKAFCPYSL